VTNERKNISHKNIRMKNIRKCKCFGFIFFYDLTKSQAASYKHFPCQNHSFRDFFFITHHRQNQTHLLWFLGSSSLVLVLFLQSMSCILHPKKQGNLIPGMWEPVLRIRIHQNHMFLGLPDPDPAPLVPVPDPSIIMQNLDSYYFVTNFDILSLKNDVNIP
jgi:hypothetical protein